MSNSSAKWRKRPADKKEDQAGFNTVSTLPSGKSHISGGDDGALVSDYHIELNMHRVGPTNPRCTVGLPWAAT